MRKVVAQAFVTLDGFTAGPNGETDWQLQGFSEEMGEYIYETYEDTDLLLLGKYTYLQFEAYWQQQSNNPEADRMNHTPKIVFSTTLPQANWMNTRLVKSNVEAEIRTLKNTRGNNMMIVGSIGLMQSLAHLDLIDEYRLLIYPVLLGAGRRWLDNIRETRQLALISSRIFSNGVMLAIYRPSQRICLYECLTAVR
ncbi:MAG: dihydrofolate reductase family protein [Chitinophaga sp.]|uniref:dihydrofolate reductase family protein n=1 Tax=Chitinophaga sp. TaxID=1869181 RepID=UPI0025BC3582|nr:dihydrofolate reductase family protein [Chitinophaga sp.]MBV8253630.1 dihydrofolate reductase family protein [Chitinophaga sp.]